jgi:hypothetical protein
MSENDSPPVTSLQFDKAEYSGPQTAASTCCACKRPITQTYYTVNAAIICDQCRGKVRAYSAGGSRFTRAFMATVLGLLAGLAGAALWYAVVRSTGYEIGLIAIVVGLMVGAAVRKGARGRGGWFYQALAIVLTYCCICAQYVPDVFGELMRQFREHQAVSAQPVDSPVADNADDTTAAESASAEKPTPVAAAPKPGIVKQTLLIAALLVVAFVIALAVPFLAGFQNLIGLLIIGIALYEAWKINKRSSVQIAGPFQLGASAACGVTEL